MSLLFVQNVNFLSLQDDQKDVLIVVKNFLFAGLSFYASFLKGGWEAWSKQMAVAVCV